MSEPLLATFGIGSAVVNIVGLIPYVRDIFAGKTKPERATWWVWLGLGIAALIAQIQAGARWSIVMTVGNILAVGLIAALSVRYGYGRFHKRDLVSLLVAALGIAVSQYLKSPLFALLVIVVVDLIGFWLTLYKTWFAPHSETLIAWILAAVSALMAAVAVGKIDATLLIYPLYLLVGNALLVAIIMLRRPVVAQK